MVCAWGESDSWERLFLIGMCATARPNLGGLQGCQIVAAVQLLFPISSRARAIQLENWVIDAGITDASYPASRFGM